MRKLRIKSPGEGFYHITSRCVDRAFKFEDDDKTMIVGFMRRMATFCGIEILTYAVLSNHFHILIHVLPPIELTDDVILRRVRALYGNEYAERIASRWTSYRKFGDEEHMNRLKKEQLWFTHRMGDISLYMKELKQWISRVYNKGHNRKGTLWEDRFASVILEGSTRTLSMVAAYIDLNAVRAGIVKNPEDYKWSGYGSACSGSEIARSGLVTVYARGFTNVTWTEVQKSFQGLLDAKEPSPPSKESRDAEEQIKENPSSTKKIATVALHHRNEYFTRGIAIGNQDFIKGIYRQYGSSLPKKYKKDYSNIPISNDLGNIYTARYAI